MDKNPVKIIKLSKSIFTGDKNLEKILKEKDIKEIHIT
jgi:nicotinamidase-related amidase